MGWGEGCYMEGVWDGEGVWIGRRECGMGRRVLHEEERV